MSHDLDEHFEIEYGKPDRKKIDALIRRGKKSDVPKKGCGCVNKCPHTISNSVGEYLIIVTRNSYNLPIDLPYCIWGTLYVDSNYGIILNPLMPTGYIFVGNTILATGDMLFTYGNGIDFDTITVSVPTFALISYVDIISGLKTNYMKSCFMTFDCNAANQAQTLDNSVILYTQSLGLFFQKAGATGNKGAQLIIPKSRRQINNSVMNVIEIYLRNEPIKPETVWVHTQPYLAAVLGVPPTPLEYNFTVFVTETTDMNGQPTNPQ